MDESHSLDLQLPRPASREAHALLEAEVVARARAGARKVLARPSGSSSLPRPTSSRRSKRPWPASGRSSGTGSQLRAEGGEPAHRRGRQRRRNRGRRRAPGLRPGKVRHVEHKTVALRDWMKVVRNSEAGPGTSCGSTETWRSGRGEARLGRGVERGTVRPSEGTRGWRVPSSCHPETAMPGGTWPRYALAGSHEVAASAAAEAVRLILMHAIAHHRLALAGKASVPPCATSKKLSVSIQIAGAWLAALGRTLVRVHQDARAAAILRQAIAGIRTSKRPGHPGISTCNEGRFAEAIPVLEEAAFRQPWDAETLLGVVGVRVRLRGRGDLTRRTPFGWPWCRPAGRTRGRGRVGLEEARRYEDAEEAFRAVHRNRPESRTPRPGSGGVASRFAQQALLRLRRAVCLGPKTHSWDPPTLCAQRDRRQESGSGGLQAAGAPGPLGRGRYAGALVCCSISTGGTWMRRRCSRTSSRSSRRPRVPTLSWTGPQLPPLEPPSERCEGPSRLMRSTGTLATGRPAPHRGALPPSRAAGIGPGRFSVARTSSRPEAAARSPKRTGTAGLGSRHRPGARPSGESGRGVRSPGLRGAEPAEV